MKKLLLPTLMMGLAFSSFTVFAEQDDNNGFANGLVQARQMSYRGDDHENEGNGKKIGQLSADVVIPKAPEISKVDVVSEKLENFYSKLNAKGQSYANRLIKERVNSLNETSKVINANKTLTDTQKTSLNAILTSNVTGLTALKATIASTTDASSTKALSASIFTNFRIYGIVIPQVRLEKRVFDLQNHSQKLSELFVKVQTKIDEAKGKGKDVTAWQKNLDDSKVLVATDMSKLAGLLTKLGTLTPAMYGTTSKAMIDSANADLKSIAKDFNSIAKNLRRPAYLGNGTGTTTPPVVVPPVTPPTSTTTAPTSIAGTCGSSHNTTVSVAPTANLCTSGVATTVSGSGPWTWSCAGVNGGATASCSASKTVVVTPPAASGYTTAQVATHNTASDCWLALNGKAYDVTSYISMHPGGANKIINRCGTDDSAGFNQVGSHSSAGGILGGLLKGNLI